MVTMSTEYEKLLLSFLNSCNIRCSSIHELDNLHIPRELLVNDSTYDSIVHYIPRFKTRLSSSYLTSLQAPATEIQKWPLLNLVRQILKTYNYLLKPKRLANGYTKTGKKLYKRIFRIVNLNQPPQ